MRHSIIEVFFLPLVIHFAMHALDEHVLCALEYFVMRNYLLVLITLVGSKGIRIFGLLPGLCHRLHNLSPFHSISFDKLLLFHDDLLKRPAFFKCRLKSGLKFFITHHVALNFSWNFGKSFRSSFTSVLQNFNFWIANSVNKFFYKAFSLPRIFEFIFEPNLEPCSI
jgi:hypothetical protein